MGCINLYQKITPTIWGIDIGISVYQLFCTQVGSKSRHQRPLLIGTRHHNVTMLFFLAPIVLNMRRRTCEICSSCCLPLPGANVELACCFNPSEKIFIYSTTSFSFFFPFSVYSITICAVCT